MTITSNAKKIENFYFAEKLINERNHKVLDVRSPVLYRDGTIFEAPNAPLRNFITEFIRVRKDTNKIILVGSKDEQSDLDSCIRYANSFQLPIDKKELKLSYVLFEDMIASKSKK